MALYQFMCGSTVMIILLCRGCNSQRPVCGRASFNTRIVGGEDADPGAWPWMASLNFNGEPVCAGSLITNQWVLTAAHCLGKYLTNATVFLGRNSQSGPNFHEVSRGLERIESHPGYDSRTIDNDIGLLKLSAPVTFTNYIHPVCLASADSTFHTGVSSWAAGFGANKTHSYTSTLQEVNLPVVGNNECKCTYSDLTENMMCAGLRAGGKDACQRDSGGALVTKKGSMWIQSGIVSFGDGCGAVMTPGVYTRVSQYQKWISSTIGSSKPGFVTYTSSGVDSDLNFDCSKLRLGATATSTTTTATPTHTETPTMPVTTATTATPTDTETPTMPKTTATHTYTKKNTMPNTIATTAPTATTATSVTPTYKETPTMPVTTAAYATPTNTETHTMPNTIATPATTATHTMPKTTATPAYTKTHTLPNTIATNAPTATTVTPTYTETPTMPITTATFATSTNTETYTMPNTIAIPATTATQTMTKTTATPAYIKPPTLPNTIATNAPTATTVTPTYTETTPMPNTFATIVTTTTPATPTNIETTQIPHTTTTPTDGDSVFDSGGNLIHFSKFTRSVSLCLLVLSLYVLAEKLFTF